MNLNLFLNNVFLFFKLPCEMWVRTSEGKKREPGSFIYHSSTQGCTTTCQQQSFYATYKAKYAYINGGTEKRHKKQHVFWWNMDFLYDFSLLNYSIYVCMSSFFIQMILIQLSNPVTEYPRSLVLSTVSRKKSLTVKLYSMSPVILAE